MAFSCYNWVNLVKKSRFNGFFEVYFGIRIRFVLNFNPLTGARRSRPYAGGKAHFAHL